MFNFNSILLTGLMCEILWSDPRPHKGCGPSKQGVGLSFGEDVTKRFLQENNLGNVSFQAYALCLLSAYFLGSF